MNKEQIIMSTGAIAAVVLISFSVYHISRLPEIYLQQRLARQQMAFAPSAVQHNSRDEKHRVPATTAVLSPASAVKKAPSSDAVDSAQKYIQTLAVKFLLRGINGGETPQAFFETSDTHLTKTYQIGDFLDQAEIKDITPERVTIEYAGVRADLGFVYNEAEEKPCKQIGQFERLVDMRAVSAALPQAAQEANKLSIAPARDGQSNKIIGLKISNIEAKGVLNGFGLENEDIISTVNGKGIHSMPEAINTIMKFKGSSNIEIGIFRNNLPLLLKYQVK